MGVEAMLKECKDIIQIMTILWFGDDISKKGRNLIKLIVLVCPLVKFDNFPLCIFTFLIQENVSFPNSESHPPS